MPMPSQEQARWRAHRHRDSMNAARTETEHITRRHLKIRECTHDEIIDVKWVPTLHNISDLCTKPLDKSTFLRHLDTMMPPMHIVVAYASLHGEAVHA